MRDWSEHLLIRYLCENPKQNSKFLVKIKHEIFIDDIYNRTIKRILSFHQQTGRLLTWKELDYDEALPNRVLNKLRIREKKRLELLSKDATLDLPDTTPEVKALISKLIVKSQHNALIELQNDLFENLKKDDLTRETVTGILTNTTKKIEDIEKYKVQTGSILSSTDTKLKKLWSYVEGREEFYVKTGFNNFDKRNLGIPLDSTFIMSSVPGGGKCIKQDSLIPTSKGILTIKELWDNSEDKIDKNGFRNLTGKVNSHLNTKSNIEKSYKTKGKTLKINTTYLDELEGLPEHKLWTVDNTTSDLCFKTLDTLKVGDYITKSIGTNLFGNSIDLPIPKYNSSIFPTKLTENLVKMFSYLLADNLDINLCEKAVHKNFKVSNPLLETEQNQITYFLNCHLGTLVNNEIQIPKCIRQASKQLQLVFLRSIFEYNSFIYVDKSILQCTIDYTASKTFIYQLKALLENLGIFCTLRVRDNIYTLFIEEYSLTLFEDLIGFISDSKKELLKQGISFQKLILKNNSKVTLLPGKSLFLELISILKDIDFSTFGHLKELDADLNKFVLNDLNTIIKDNYNKIKDIHRINYLLAILNKYAEYSWTKVTEITKLDKIIDVYDLSIKDTHSYASNGLMSHNSAMALQMSLNAFRRGAKVCFVSLEMSKEQNYLRLAASLTGIPISDISKNPKIFRKKIARTFKKVFHSRRDDAKLDFYLPEDSLTIDQLFAFLKPMHYDMIVIDYISLLEPLHKDMWRSLDLAGRSAKMYSTANKTVTMLLSQWDADNDKIRYSKALIEHGSNAWKWITTEEELREHGILDIYQIKARNQEPFPFQLYFNTKIARITDYTGDVEITSKSYAPKNKRGNYSKGRNKRKDYTNAVTEEFDDISPEDDI